MYPELEHFSSTSNLPSAFVSTWLGKYLRRYWLILAQLINPFPLSCFTLTVRELNPF